MDVPVTLAEQLQTLSRSSDPDPGPDGGLMAGLVRLSRAVVVVVPSCSAVSITLTRLGVDVMITAPATGQGRVLVGTAVQASLALPVPAAGHDGVLVLQASAPGAFLPLADALATLLRSGQPSPVVDAHLSRLSVSTAALAESLAELRLLDRALGVLIDRGWTPEAGVPELHRRAAAAGLPVAAVARGLLTTRAPTTRPEVD